MVFSFSYRGALVSAGEQATRNPPARHPDSTNTPCVLSFKKVTSHCKTSGHERADERMTPNSNCYFITTDQPEGCAPAVFTRHEKQRYELDLGCKAARSRFAMYLGAQFERRGNERFYGSPRFACGSSVVAERRAP